MKKAFHNFDPFCIIIVTSCHAMIYMHPFILISVQVHSESFQQTLGIRWDTANTHTQIYNLVKPVQTDSILVTGRNQRIQGEYVR